MPTSQSTDNSRPRSIYERAARDGLWAGVYFLAIFLLSVASTRLAILNVVVLTMLLLVPFILYRRLRLTHIAAHGMETFAGLWMQGILMFLFGALIFSAASYIYMRVISPDFIPEILAMGAEYYRRAGTEAATELADEIDAVIEHHAYPGASTLAILWLEVVTFTGSVLSLFEAMIVKLSKLPPAHR